MGRREGHPVRQTPQDQMKMKPIIRIRGRCPMVAMRDAVSPWQGSKYSQENGNLGAVRDIILDMVDPENELPYAIRTGSEVHEWIDFRTDGSTNRAKLLARPARCRSGPPA